jgi:hypothetical protein
MMRSKDLRTMQLSLQSTLHYCKFSGSDNCKDVDVVSVLPECSVSTTTGSLGSEMVISDSSGKKLNPNNYFLNKIVLMQ